jgi:hypothetical protein
VGINFLMLHQSGYKAPEDLAKCYYKKNRKLDQKNINPTTVATY